MGLLAHMQNAHSGTESALELATSTLQRIAVMLTQAQPCSIAQSKHA
jgi:hypothetical protein